MSKISRRGAGTDSSAVVTFPHRRQARIAAIVREQGAVSVHELSRLCDVSTLTIRRDLDLLSERGLVQRTHGGAVVAHNQRPDDRSPDDRTARGSILDRVDVLILTPANLKASRIIQQRAARRGIPIVAEAQPIEGAATLVTLDNFQAGLVLGRWTGQRLRRDAAKPVQTITISVPLTNTEARQRGFVQGLNETFPDARIPLNVFADGHRESAHDLMTDVLSVYPDIDVIFSVNDAMLQGALNAYGERRSAGTEPLALTIGLEGNAGKNLLMGGRWRGAAIAMFPEVVGRACVDAAICSYAGLSLPAHIVTPSVIVTPDSLEQYYRRLGSDWKIRWDAVQPLWAPHAGFDRLKQSEACPRPRRIGFIYGFSAHEWYQNVLVAMRQRAEELGIVLEAVDASESLNTEMEELKISAARSAAQLIKEGDTIILDSGSTITYLAAELASFQNITVVTNSISALTALSKASGITPVSLGGVLQPRTGALVGSAAIAALANLHVDKVFLSASSVELTTGLYAPNPEEAAVKQAMIRAAREVYLVVDHTKLGENVVSWFAPLSAVTTLVTDDSLPARDRLLLNQSGVRVCTPTTR